MRGQGRTPDVGDKRAGTTLMNHLRRYLPLHSE